MVWVTKDSMEMTRMRAQDGSPISECLRYYLDGYNLLFALPEAPEELAMGRDWLIVQLQPFASHGRREVILVFDAPAQEGIAARHHTGDLELVYTAKGESADAYILTELEHQSNPRICHVVSRDRRLLREAVSLGAVDVDPAVLWTKVSQHEKPSHNQPQSSKRDRQRWLKIFSEKLERSKGDE